MSLPDEVLSCHEASAPRGCTRSEGRSLPAAHGLLPGCPYSSGAVGKLPLASLQGEKAPGRVRLRLPRQSLLNTVGSSLLASTSPANCSPEAAAPPRTLSRSVHFQSAFHGKTPGLGAACPHRERQRPGDRQEKTATEFKGFLHGTVVSAENMPRNQRRAEKEARSKPPAGSSPAPPAKATQLVTNCHLLLRPGVPRPVPLLSFPRSARQPCRRAWGETGGAAGCCGCRLPRLARRLPCFRPSPAQPHADTSRFPQAFPGDPHKT